MSTAPQRLPQHVQDQAKAAARGLVQSGLPSGQHVSPAQLGHLKPDPTPNNNQNDNNALARAKVLEPQAEQQKASLAAKEVGKGSEPTLADQLQQRVQEAKQHEPQKPHSREPQGRGR